MCSHKTFSLLKVCSLILSLNTTYIQISRTGTAISTAFVVAECNSSISWEEAYKILLRWLGVLIFYVLLFGVIYLA
jgi:phosphate/sulfate permease